MGLIVVGAVCILIGLLQIAASGLFTTALRYRMKTQVSDQHLKQLCCWVGALEVMLGIVLIIWALIVEMKYAHWENV